MHNLRLALVTLICWSLIWILCREISAGLRSGKIAYGRNRQLCHRTKNPVSFWFLVTLFVGFAGTAMYAWWCAVVQPVLS